MASSTCDGRRPGGGLLGAVLVLLASAPSARAASCPASDAAGSKKAAEAQLYQGVELLKIHDYRRALERFEEAYGLLPSLLIFYDLGLAHLGLGDAPLALESFDRFLAAAPDAPADKRRRAEKYRAELRPQVSVVTIEANVPAAELLVDGLPLGRVSLPRQLYLAPGSHEVVARAGGSEQPTTISCLAGQTLTFSLQLEHPPAPMVVAPPAGQGPVSPLGNLPPALAPPPTGAVAVLQTSPPPGRESWARPWVLSAAAVGVVSIGVGIALGVAARNDANEVTGESHNGGTFTPSAESAGLRDQQLDVAFLALGAAAVVAGASLYAWVRHHEGGHATAEVGP